MIRNRFGRRRRQSGQAVVLIAFMIIVIIGAVGLAVDGGIAYYYNASAERAAAAAALSGVVFMPYQFNSASAIPAGSQNDASDRAFAAARKNNFDVTSPITCTATTCTGTGANGVVITTSTVAGFDNKLQVTASRQVSTFFMGFFGLQTYTVSRTAIATYLPPLKLGQPGGKVGSSVSELGNGGYYYLRTEGYATDRGQGDAYTPSQNAFGCGPACPSGDYHQLSVKAGTDLADPNLPFWGGYNYMVTVPAGTTAQIQVYNAAFAPDGNGAAANHCENQTAPAPAACSASANYWMHEDDGSCFNSGNCLGNNHDYSTKTDYAAMEYTIFNAPSVFIRSFDNVLSQMVVRPIDARNYGGAPPNYTDVNTGKVINQKYNAVTGLPTNMLAYHAWMNVGSYAVDGSCLVVICTANEEPESALISYKPGRGPIGALGPGTYRLRIDTLSYDGTNPCDNAGNNCTGISYAHKGLAVRVRDGAGGVCGGCTMSALDDMSMFTPFESNTGGSFQVPVFQLPPDYAGQTISVDIFDAGDMNGTGSVYIGLYNPDQCGVACGGLLVEPPGAPASDVWNLGNCRCNLGTPLASLLNTYPNPSPVEQVVNSNGTGREGDNRWYHFDIAVPNNYAPGPNPANWWWSLNYRITANVHAGDTITITVNLKGNPAHLLQS